MFPPRDGRETRFGDLEGTGIKGHEVIEEVAIGLTAEHVHDGTSLDSSMIPSPGGDGALHVQSLPCSRIKVQMKDGILTLSIITLSSKDFEGEKREGKGKYEHHVRRGTERKGNEDELTNHGPIDKNSRMTIPGHGDLTSCTDGRSSQGT